MKYQSKTVTTPTLLIRIFIMLFVFIGMVLPTYFATSNSHIECKSYTLNDNWDITINRETYKDESLNTFDMGMRNRGDYVVYETTLPSRISVIEEPVLCFFSMHSVVHIYVDHKLIYSYGAEYFNHKELVGYGSHFVPIPANSAGKQIMIELVVSENAAFNAQQAPVIKDGRFFIPEKITTKRLQFSISLFLIICGVTFMFFSILHLKAVHNFTERYCVATFSFLIGFWSLCDSDLITLIVTDLSVKTKLEFICFYTFTIPFTYYFKPKVFLEERPKYLKTYFNILFTTELIFAVTSIVCNMTKILRFPSFMLISHVILVAVVIFVLLIFYTEKNNKSSTQTPLIITFMLATVFIFLELFRLNISKYVLRYNDLTYNATLCYCGFLIVCSLLYDFERSVSKNFSKEMQQDLLMEFAYSDSLSGLSNRRKCEETLKMFTDLKTPYTVISLDMNYLKKINDTYGHHVGDAMICDFSQILQEIFGTYGTVGRMGGDEFIVILPETKSKQVNRMLQTMEERMAQYNVSPPPKQYQLSCAYGFAQSSEATEGSSFLAAYNIADERMYEHKRKSRIVRG